MLDELTTESDDLLHANKTKTSKNIASNR